VGFVVEDYIYDFQYLTNLVRKSINVKDRYRVENGLSVDSLWANKVIINKASSGSTVQEYVDRVEFAGIGYTEFYSQN